MKNILGCKRHIKFYRPIKVRGLYRNQIITFGACYNPVEKDGMQI
jgi:hypothetical protein